MDRADSRPRARARARKLVRPETDFLAEATLASIGRREYAFEHEDEPEHEDDYFGQPPGC